MRLVDAELATLRVIAIRGAQTAASNAAMGAFGARTPMRFVSSRENKRSDTSIQDTAA